jgi:F0F1-type ATP synthase delta subunit
MKTPRHDIADVIAKRNLKAGASKKFASEIAAYLLDEGRVSELDPLLRDIQADWAEQGYVEAIAVSAHPLGAKAKTLIKDKVRSLYPKAKKIIITEQHDPEALGGVRIELPNQQLDLSIEAKLNKFKQLTTGKD